MPISVNAGGINKTQWLLTGIVSAAVTMLANVGTTETTVVEVTGTAGVLTRLAVADGIDTGTTKTVKVYLDGTVVYTLAGAAATDSAAIADLLGDSVALRRAFPNGLWFRSSCKITVTYGANVAGSLDFTYEIAKVTS